SKGRATEDSCLDSRSLEPAHARACASREYPARRAQPDRGSTRLSNNDRRLRPDTGANLRTCGPQPNGGGEHSSLAPLAQRTAERSHRRKIVNGTCARPAAPEKTRSTGAGTDYRQGRATRTRGREKGPAHSRRPY